MIQSLVSGAGVPKKIFNFTSNLMVFEACHRQCQFFRHYEFMPSISAEFYFGALVHRLANALSVLYPKDSEEKRLLDAMLLGMPR